MSSGTHDSGLMWTAPSASFQVRLGMSDRSPSGVCVRAPRATRSTSMRMGSSVESPRNTKSMQSYLIRSSWKMDDESPPNEMGTCGCRRLRIFATSMEPWQ